MAESLENGLKGVKKTMSVENYENNDVRNQITEILDQFTENLDQNLPPLPKQGFTRLDKLIRERRHAEWRSLQRDVDDLRKNLDKAHQELVSDVEDFMLRLKALAVEVSERG